MTKPAPGLCSIVPLFDAAPTTRTGRTLGLVAAEWRVELAAWGDGALEVQVEIQASATGDLWTPITTLKVVGTDEAVTAQAVRLVNAAHYRAAIVRTVGEVQRVRVIASRSRDSEVAKLEQDTAAALDSAEKNRALLREYLDSLEAFTKSTDAQLKALEEARLEDRKLLRQYMAQTDELLALIRTARESEQPLTLRVQ